MKKRFLVFSAATGLFATIGLVAQVSSQNDQAPPQMREAPTPDARYDNWAAQRAGQPIQASVRFGKLESDARVQQMLRGSGAMPYAVHMFLDDRYGTHRTAPGNASLAVIGKARAETILMQDSKGKGIVARAKALKAQGDAADPTLARTLPRVAQQHRNALAGLRGGAPMIYGVAVTGTRAQLAALASTPGVVSVTPGIILPSGEVAVDSPEAPAQRGNAARATMSDAEIDSAIDRFAAGNLEE